MEKIRDRRKKIDLDTDVDVRAYLNQVCTILEPVIEGHGCKDSSKTRSWFGFHRKYFVLYDGILLYYDHKSNYLQDKSKGLKTGKRILLKDLYLTKPEPSEAPSTGYSFYLHAPHSLNKKHKVLLVFHSRRDRAHWCNALQAQNPSLLSPPFLPFRKPDDAPQKKVEQTVSSFSIQT